MGDNKKTANDILDSVVGNLLNLPVQNLEEKILQLETEIKLRNHLKDQAISSLSTQQLRIKDHLKRLRYEFESSRKTSLEIEKLKLERDKINSWQSWFTDLHELNEKLQSAKEELSIEKEKRKLL